VMCMRIYTLVVHDPRIAVSHVTHTIDRVCKVDCIYIYKCVYTAINRCVCMHVRVICTSL
jgi:hypothetical protein